MLLPTVGAEGDLACQVLLKPLFSHFSESSQRLTKRPWGMPVSRSQLSPAADIQSGYSLDQRQETSRTFFGSRAPPKMDPEALWMSPLRLLHPFSVRNGC